MMSVAGRPRVPRRPTGPPAAAGFTMVEVLVTMGVLTVAFLGVITVFLTGHADISQSGRDTAAAVAAQSLAENMLNQQAPTLDQLNGMTTADPTACPGAPGDRINTVCTDWINQVAPLPQGLGTVTVTQIPNPTTGIMMRQVSINVSWVEAARGTRQFTLVVGRSN